MKFFQEYKNSQKGRVDDCVLAIEENVIEANETQQVPAIGKVSPTDSRVDYIEVPDKYLRQFCEEISEEQAQTRYPALFAFLRELVEKKKAGQLYAAHQRD